MNVANVQGPCTAAGRPNSFKAFRPPSRGILLVSHFSSLIERTELCSKSTTWALLIVPLTGPRSSSIVCRCWAFKQMSNINFFIYRSYVIIICSCLFEVLIRGAKHCAHVPIVHCTISMNVPACQMNESLLRHSNQF